MINFMVKAEITKSCTRGAKNCSVTLLKLIRQDCKVASVVHLRPYLSRSFQSSDSCRISIGTDHGMELKDPSSGSER